jgi:hypothetical protein
MYTERQALSYHEHDICSQNTTHRVANKNDIRGRGLMGAKPFAEVISSNVYRAIGLVAWIYLGMNDMRVGQEVGEKSMNMSRE